LKHDILMSSETNDYIVKPVYKALQVLECLGREHRKLSLAEICHLVRLPKTTVFRYLYTLEACGFVSHDPMEDLYWVGLRVFELARSVSEELHVREIALPFMRQLRDQFDETVNLGILNGQEVAYIEMMESRRSLRMQARLGSHDPVYSTALGKVILAFTPEEQWPQHLPKQLSPRTGRTHTSHETLWLDLKETRRRGYSLDREENEEGAHCIGAPIFSHLGQVIAAISVSAPIGRLIGNVERVAQATLQTATTISGHLGYHQPIVKENR
jgi:DNA-binding IclR family transcriptional regulator